MSLNIHIGPSQSSSILPYQPPSPAPCPMSSTLPRLSPSLQSFTMSSWPHFLCPSHAQGIAMLQSFSQSCLNTWPIIFHLRFLTSLLNCSMFGVLSTSLLPMRSRQLVRILLKHIHAMPCHLLSSSSKSCIGTTKLTVLIPYTTLPSSFLLFSLNSIYFPA